jgi:hypothetical protein
MQIGFRLAHADPGRDVSNATIFNLCMYTSTEVIYKTTDIPLIPSSRSPLLSSPGLPSSHSISLSSALRLDLSSTALLARPCVDDDVVRLSTSELYSVMNLIAKASHLTSATARSRLWPGCARRPIPIRVQQRGDLCDEVSAVLQHDIRTALIYSAFRR